MAHGHRGVLAQEQHGGRFADDVGAAHDRGMLPGQLDARALEQLDRGMCGGRQVALVAERQQAGVERVDAVDVLARVERVEHDAQGDAVRERLLHDDAGHLRVGVESFDGARQLIGAALTVELHQPSADADALAAVEDALEVDHRGRVGSHGHDGQLRRVAELGGE